MKDLHFVSAIILNCQSVNSVNVQLRHHCVTRCVIFYYWTFLGIIVSLVVSSFIIEHFLNIYLAICLDNCSNCLFYCCDLFVYLYSILFLFGGH